MIMYYAENRNEFNNEKYDKYFKDIKINNADIFEWGKELKIYKEKWYPLFLFIFYIIF